jgi:protein TonB
MKSWLLTLAIVFSAALTSGAIAQNQASTSDSLPPVEEKIPPPDTFTYFDTAPRQINDVLQVWPERVTTPDFQGKVTVQYFVDKKGFPRQIHSLKATPTDMGLEDAAVETIKRMRFTPAQHNGKPVGIWVAQVVQFKAR